MARGVISKVKVFVVSENTNHKRNFRGWVYEGYAYNHFLKWATVPSQYTVHVGTRGFQVEARTTAIELERCPQERSQENGHQLGRNHTFMQTALGGVNPVTQVDTP